MSITYNTSVNRLGEHHIATLYVHNIEMGEFTIYTHCEISSMTIHVDESIQGCGYSKRMMAMLLGVLKWSDDTRLYIDSDASVGFWDACGLTENQNDNGYEKVVTFGDLNRWATR